MNCSSGLSGCLNRRGKALKEKNVELPVKNYIAFGNM